MKKGISDIIAVVLMIAVAIAIGVFVTTFATKWVSEQTSSASIDCAIKTNYVVSDVKFNFSNDAVLSAKITNKGDQGLYGFSFVLENATRIKTFKSDYPFILNQVPASSPVEREESVLVKINLSSNTTVEANNNIFTDLARTATKLTVRNTACTAVSASSTSITAY